MKSCATQRVCYCTHLPKVQGSLQSGFLFMTFWHSNSPLLSFQMWRLQWTHNQNSAEPVKSVRDTLEGAERQTQRAHKTILINELFQKGKWFHNALFFFILHAASLLLNRKKSPQIMLIQHRISLAPAINNQAQCVSDFIWHTHQM